MAGRQRHKRGGLTGVPITSYEVAEFDALRATGPGSDFRVLVECWVGVAIIFALAVWGDAPGLATVGVIATLVLLWWTAVKVRSWRSARRLTLRTLVEERPSGPPPASANAEGWCPDPTGRHEQRWFSMGMPTKLVRDGAVETQDPRETHIPDN